MPETFGSMLMRLSKLPHGAAVDAEVLAGYLNDRYQTLLGYHPWTRLNVNTQLVVPAAYTTGTVAITNGLTALVGTDTVWTAAMTGRRMRIANGAEYYTFTRTSATAGTIDRAFEGTTVTAGTYRIWQAVFEMVDTVEYFQSIEVPRLGIDLDQRSQEYLDFIDPGRKQDTGGPWCFAPYQDSTDGSPQIEIYPGPDTAESLPMRYRKSIVAFVFPTDTATEFPNWVDTATLFAGVEADLYMLQGEHGAKEIKEKDFADGLSQSVRQDNQRVVPSTMRMADRYTQHRKERSLGGEALRQSRLDRM